MSPRVRNLMLLCTAALVVLAMDVAGVLALASSLGGAPRGDRAAGVLHDGAVAARIVARVASGLGSAVTDRLAGRQTRMRSFTPRRMTFAMEAVAVPAKPCPHACSRAAMREVQVIEMRCQEECAPAAPAAPTTSSAVERAPAAPMRQEHAPRAETPMEHAAHAVAIPMAL